MSTLQTLQITPAAQWRNRHIMKLPSGLVGEFRKIDLMTLLMEAESKDVPNFLRNQVVDQLNNPGKKAVDEKWVVTPENLPELSKLINLFVKSAFVNPAIRPNPNYDAGEIDLSDVVMEDRLHLFNWSMPSEVGRAADFLQGSQTDVGSALSGAPVREEAESDLGIPEHVGALDAG